MTSQSLWGRLCATRPGAAPVVLRIALAVTLWPHGLQKMFGWFGGFGFTRHILALAMSVALVIRGGGSVSFDRRWNPSDS